MHNKLENVNVSPFTFFYISKLFKINKLGCEVRMMSQRKEKVRTLHKQGYNCAQAFLCSYQELLKLDEKELFKLAEGLGRGIAGLEEICCIPILMAMICSYLETSDGNVDHPKSKLKSYACGKCLAMDFKEQVGSLCCHKLLKENKEKKRSCSDLLEKGVAILDECLK